MLQLLEDGGEVFGGGGAERRIAGARVSWRSRAPLCCMPGK
jgi:hypothetical protein